MTEVQEIPHKGFTYVTLENTDEARVKRCVFTLNSTKFKGKALKIAVAKKEFQQVWTERQAADIKQVEERRKTQAKKDERRATTKELPTPTASLKSSAYDDETFLPSNPYGWMKVKGRYVAIFRVPKKGREGGFLFEPKAYAHNIQSVLCHVKPIRINKILTEFPESLLDEDKEHSSQRKQEASRWANGVMKQRHAEGDSIADYSKFMIDSDSDQDSDDEGQKKTSRSRSRRERDSDSDDFEEVGDSRGSDDDSYADSYADSFSDIEEIAGDKRKNKVAEKKSVSSANKPGSASAVDTSSKMMSVIDSILKHKQGSDYGDSDSQDFEMNPSSGESSPDASENGEQSDDDEDSESEGFGDDDDGSESESDSSEISAKSFSEDDGDDHTGVVDFESGDEEERVELPTETMDVDESSEDENQVFESETSSATSEPAEVPSIISNGAQDDSDDDIQLNIQSDRMESNESEEEEEDEFEEDSEDYSDESEESEEIVQVKQNGKGKSSASSVLGPQRLKLDAVDSDDDIGLNIYSTAPVPKAPVTKPQAPSNDAKLPDRSSENKAENDKKRKRDESSESEAESDSEASSSAAPVWSADLMADNKKFAYSELVREQDERIFAAMRDDASSSKASVKTFSFLQRAPEESEAAAAPAVDLSILDTLPSLSSASSSKSHVELAIKKSRTPTGESGATKIERSKMTLFGGLSSPSKAASTQAGATTSSFVRTTEVDRINKHWGSTKGAQRQLAERSHKLATKRVKSSKNHS